MKNIILIIILILSINTISSARTLYINVVDTDNSNSLLDYYREKVKNFKYKDTFIILDSKNMQYITSFKLDRGEVSKYRNKRLFTYRIEKILNKYEKQLDKRKISYIKEHIFTSETNDLARQFKEVSNLLEVYKDRYSTVKVMFFGDSYLHKAYGHDFSKGIPTDGFIYSDESEFNSFLDILAPNVEFAIFFDDEPSFSKNRIFRFYRKLIKKKFNSKLDSFNDTATFNADKDITYKDTSFYKDKISVITEKRESDCTEHDNFKVNYMDSKAEFIITLNNLCRKNSIVTFYHNANSEQVNVDSNGKTKAIFKAVIGKNIIHYFDLNAEKKIHEKVVTAPSNDIKFHPYFATGEVLIDGYNPLRGNNTQVKIYYQTTGSSIYMDVKDGKYKIRVPIKIGKNIFTWKDMNGKEHKKVINYDERCSDKIIIDEVFAQEYGIAQLVLKNECREDGGIVNFFYKDNNYTAITIKGKAEKMIILESDINEIYYKDFDGNREMATSIKIKEFSDLVRLSISYKDNGNFSLST